MSTLGGTVVMAAALGLLAIAHGVASWSSDPAHPASTLGALALVVASIAVMICAAWGLLTATRSRWRHVFCSHRVLMCGLLLLGIAVALVVFLISRDPFGDVIARGQITAHDLVGVGCVLGAVVLSVGALVALGTAWESYHEERHWSRSLIVGR